MAKSTAATITRRLNRAKHKAERAANREVIKEFPLGRLLNDTDDALQLVSYRSQIRALTDAEKEIKELLLKAKKSSSKKVKFAALRKYEQVFHNSDYKA